MPLVEPLSRRQHDLVRFVGRYVNEHGRAPTIREIADAMGVRSTNGILQHVEYAERKGALTRVACSRGLSVTAEGRAAVGLPASEAEHLRAELKTARARLAETLEEARTCTNTISDLHRLLQRVEWAFASGCCGFCGGVKSDHRAGCELVAALGSTPAREEPGC